MVKKGGWDLFRIVSSVEIWY